MINKPNCIQIPEALKGQLEPEGELEISYRLTGEEGNQSLEITGIEGEPVASEPESPMSRMKSRMGYKEDEMDAPNIA